MVRRGIWSLWQLPGHPDRVLVLRRVEPALRDGGPHHAVSDASGPADRYGGLTGKALTSILPYVSLYTLLSVCRFYLFAIEIFLISAQVGPPPERAKRARALTRPDRPLCSCMARRAG
jgi:hypothetical protein